MKTMSCKQLGGACEKKFNANSFEEIAQMSKQHGIEMLQIKDEAHLMAMNQMQGLMQNPDAMKIGLRTRKKNSMHCRIINCYESYRGAPSTLR